MATTQITIDTTQANRLLALREESRGESERLVEAAKEATERRRPGMLARSEELAGVADLLDALLEQVPAEVMDPPPPPPWVADGIALVPGQQWPHVWDAEFERWVHPGNEDEYADADGVTAQPATTEQLVEAGATRLPAILDALGQLTDTVTALTQARDERAAAEQGPAEEGEDEGEDVDDADPHRLDGVPEDELPLPGLAHD